MGFGGMEVIHQCINPTSTGFSLEQRPSFSFSVGAKQQLPVPPETAGSAATAAAGGKREALSHWGGGEGAWITNTP